MKVTVSIYHSRLGGGLSTWVSLGLGETFVQRTGRNAFKLEEEMREGLRALVEGSPPSALPRYQLKVGTSLERVHMALTLRGDGKRRKISGRFPLILEPRATGASSVVTVVYHPLRPADVFPLQEEVDLEQQATAFFQKAWAGVSDLEELLTNGRDGLRAVAFSASPRQLLDNLPDRKKDVWDDLEPKTDGTPGPPQRRSSVRVLASLGTDLTAQACGGLLEVGMAREPFREQLRLMLTMDNKTPLVLIGPPGCGKTTILKRWIADLVHAENFEVHQNQDELHHVWQLSGKRLIAGMTYVGEWEKRCVDVVGEARERKGVLFFDDLHTFGRLGRSRGSARSLADFFRGTVARGDALIIGECTSAQFQRLVEDTPRFAAAFKRLHVRPTTSAETLQMMIHASRPLERKHMVTFDPIVFRTILEVGASLFPMSAFPGKALELLGELARRHHGAALGQFEDAPEISAQDVFTLMSDQTGVPLHLLSLERALDPSSLRETLGARIRGQDAALAAAVDVIARMRTGLTAAHRPFAVYLFTGPTGTGKTEMARQLARTLFGAAERLVRLDMSEFGGFDAPGRLIGDSFAPEGLLTRKVREQPFCVILLDEIEKAHPSVLNLLLQLFDDGRLTDAAGNTVAFDHTVLIMTSNLGAKERSTVGFGGGGDEEVTRDIAKAVEAFFAPELFNRIDRVVPFVPLNPEAARQIVELELGHLFGRRGLLERNVFVFHTPKVVERVVARAFSARDGARPLKRYLEHHIGSLLSEAIIAQSAAAARVMRVFVRQSDDALALHGEVIEEAETLDAEWTLEPLLNQPIDVLAARMKPLLQRLRVLADSERLEGLSLQIRGHLEAHNLGREGHAEPMYNLEVMRLNLRAFIERVETLVESIVAAEEIDYELIEMAHFSDISYRPPYSLRERRIRGFDRRSIKGKAAVTRSALLSCLAEASHLRRALDRVHAPEQHAITIELLRIGAFPTELHEDDAASSLLSWLASFYVSRGGRLDEVSVRCLETITRTGRDGIGEDPAAQVAELSILADHVVIKLVGLCVLDLFHMEEGCHIWRSAGRRPEVVRVKVRPAPFDEGSTSAILEAHLVQAKAFAEGLEAEQDPLPPNPEALAPAVRVLRFDPPRLTGRTALAELEDFPLGYSSSARVSSMDAILEPVWWMRMTREASLADELPPP